MALVDYTHNPERAYRLAFGPGEPAAGIFQPDLHAIALEGVLHLIGHAFAGVALTGLGDRIETALPVLGLDLLRKAAAAADIGDVDAEYRGGIAAPEQRIGVEPPFIGDVADRPENLRGVRDTSRLLDSGHARPFLGTPRRTGR